MMRSQNCRCPHHVVMKVMAVLAWISGILFFWSSWWPEGGTFFWSVLKTDPFWGFNPSYWPWVVIVLFLLSKTSRGVCKCCCGDKHCDTCPVK